MQLQNTWVGRVQLFRMEFLQPLYFNLHAIVKRIIGSLASTVIKGSPSRSEMWNWGFDPLLFHVKIILYLLWVETTGSYQGSQTLLSWAFFLHPLCFLNAHRDGNSCWRQVYCLLLHINMFLMKLQSIFVFFFLHGIWIDWYLKEKVWVYPKRNFGLLINFNPSKYEGNMNRKMF